MLSSLLSAPPDVSFWLSLTVWLTTGSILKRQSTSLMPSRPTPPWRCSSTLPRAPFPYHQRPLTSPVGSRLQFEGQCARRSWGEAPCGDPQEQLSVANARVRRLMPFFLLSAPADAFDQFLFAVWAITMSDLSLECTWLRHSRSTRRSPASSMLLNSLSLLSAPVDVCV